MNSKEIEAANTKRWQLLEELKRKGVTTPRRILELRRRCSATEEQERKYSRFWDPDDQSTWVDYRDHPDLDVLYPYCFPLETGIKTHGHHVFELYRIEIKKLRPPRSQDFNMILLISDSTRYVPLVIYKREGPLPLEEEEIDDITARPLPIKFPARLPIGDMFLTILVNNPIHASSWIFNFDPLYNRFHDVKCDGILYEECKDEESGSVALLSYEIMRRAVRVMLVFRFINVSPLQQEEEEEEGEEGGEEEEEEEGGGGGGGEEEEEGEEEGGEEEEEGECQRIEILSGTISAAHFGGDHPDGDTKRIVKHFPSRKLPEVVKTNKMLPVDRHVFGVPYGSKFQVTAENLICTTTPPAGGAGGQGVARFIINDDLYFDMPKHSGSEDKCFTSTDSTILLRLTVFWGDVFV